MSEHRIEACHRRLQSVKSDICGECTDKEASILREGCGAAMSSFAKRAQGDIELTLETASSFCAVLLAN